MENPIDASESKEQTYLGKAQEFLQDQFVGPLVSESTDLVWGPRGLNVEQALAIMQKAKVSNLPIAVREDSGHLQFFGILTLPDLLTLLAQSGVGSLKLSEIQVSKLLGLAQQSKTLMVFDATDRMEYVLRYLSDHEKTHSLVNGRIWYRVLSLTDLVTFLKRNLAHLGRAFASCPIKSVIGSKALCCIPVTSTTQQAIQAMVAGQYDAIPCVDEKQRIVATVAMSDFCNLPNEFTHCLSLPITEYLLSVNGQLEPLRSCASDSTIGEALEVMHKYRVERVWIVDNQKAVGVLTIGDILKNLMQGLPCRAFSSLSPDTASPLA